MLRKRKLLLLLFVFFICVSALSCITDTEVVLSLTNEQALSVSFTGYYEVSTGDSVPMSGVTPYDHTIILRRGDQLSGMVHKDGPNMTDTLHFRLIEDNVERLNQKKVTPSQVIEFQASGG